METTAFGALAALVASGLFSAGLVLQAGESRQVDDKFSLHFALIRRLVKRPRWVEGTLLTFAGYPFHVLALLLAPLSIVQPALAAGLLLLLVIGARTPGETVRRRDWAGVGAIVIGIAVMTLSAPQRAEVEARTSELLIALAVLGLLTLVPYVAERLRGECTPGLTTMAAFAAGTAYAFSGITSKLVSDDLSDDRVASAFGWLAATAVIAGLGFLSQVTALQRRPATQVGPVVYVIPVLVPVLLAPFITGEDWGDTPLGGLVLVVSLVVVSVGAGLVSSSGHVSRATEGGPTVTLSAGAQPDR
jgi:drug/metabolite transporter (DMT)-like permease